MITNVLKTALNIIGSFSLFIKNSKIFVGRILKRDSKTRNVELELNNQKNTICKIKDLILEVSLANSPVTANNIELSNLNRQISFLETDIGKNKAEILKKNILKINAELDVNIIKKKITKRNINLFLDKSQFIIDCSDNFETRFLIN